MFRSRKVGTEIELPIYVENIAMYAEHADTLWYDLTAELGAEWVVSTDIYRGGATGISRTIDGATTVLTFDSSIFLFEFAMAPKSSITELERAWHEILPCVLSVLSRYGATLLGIGMHPALDIASGDAMPLWRTKRGIYQLLDARGWNHRSILHCASTQPAVDVYPDEIVNVINTLEYTLPLLQPVFANSPFVQWKQNPEVVDNRDLLAWKSVMRSSVDASAQTVGMPVAPYTDLSDYYAYLHSIPLFYLHHSKKSYKNSDCLVPLTDPKTNKPPSLRQLYDAKQWKGYSLNNPDHIREFVLDDFDVNVNAGIDWYSFRPVRLHSRLKKFDSWDQYFEIMTRNPEEAIEGAYLEIRSIDTQLPGQEFLPTATVLAIVRMHEKIRAWLQSHLAWSDVRAFYESSAHTSSAWMKQIGNHSYTDIVKELVTLLLEGLTAEELHYIAPLSDRVARMTSAASLVMKAYAAAPECFFQLTTYRTEQPRVSLVL